MDGCYSGTGSGWTRWRAIASMTATLLEGAGHLPTPDGERLLIYTHTHTHTHTNTHTHTHTHPFIPIKT